MYNTLITAIGFVLNTIDFQLTDFSEKALSRVTAFFVHFMTWRPFYFVDMLTQHIDDMHTRCILRVCIEHSLPGTQSTLPPNVGVSIIKSHYCLVHAASASDF